MRRCALLTVLLLAGCGGDDPPSAVVPADAAVYVSLSADRAEQLVAGTSRADVVFDRDVRPWLGDRAAYFTDGSADSGGLVFESEDDESAEAFGRKVTAAGPLRASAIIDGHLVVTSTRELLRAANAAAGGQALADSTRLDVNGETSSDVLVAALEPRTFVASLEQFLHDLPDDLPSVDFGAGAMTGRATSERIELSGLAERPEPPSLADAGADATFAIASGDLSEGDDLAYADARLRPREGALAPLKPFLGAGTIVLEGDGGRLEAEVTGDPPLDDFKTARISGERLTIDFAGGVSGTGRLGETKRYQEAEKVLGGPPTLMAEDFVARRAGDVLVVSR